MAASAPTIDAALEKCDVSLYRIPTDVPEADGTYAWDSTTLVLVHLQAGGQKGLGYTYANAATAAVVRDQLRPVIVGQSAERIPQLWIRMVQAVRNLGRQGIASMAISAVDAALWDLKGKLLGVSLAELLGSARGAAPIYGSGGFTSYSLAQLQQQLAGWVHGGITQVKMKIGAHPSDDLNRVRAAREAIGADTKLMVDANGAYHARQALEQGAAFADVGVVWFEEPVSSDDLSGLRFIREHVAGGIEIAAGEYGYDTPYFRRMLSAGAVDVIQADATRCGGITGFMQAAALCEAFGVDLSSHCAPALHVAACCAATRFRHMEYFHDHVRIERMLFDGLPEPQEGKFAPDVNRPGLGLEFRGADAKRYAVDG
jgi:L-alanine-DL-glutamate epimerase-like enolase superfamily enzyme